MNTTATPALDVRTRDAIDTLALKAHHLVSFATLMACGQHTIGGDRENTIEHLLSLNLELAKEVLALVQRVDDDVELIAAGAAA